MASLRTTPGTSTSAQRKLLHRIKRNKGWSDDELHAACGADSVTDLSAAQANACITRLTGRGLPHPPGQMPTAYQGKRKTPGVERMRDSNVVEQIRRLGLWFFAGDPDRFAHWLEVNYGIRDPDQIDTAEKAGQIAWVLKGMLERRAEKEAV